MSEWLLGKLGDIAEIVMGQSPTGESVNTDGLGTPLLNGPTEFTIRYPQAVQFSTEPKRFSKVDDILFCVRGSTTGRMNWANASYAIGRGLAAIRHKQGKEYRYFVKAVLDYYLDTMLASASGSTFPNVSKDQLNDLEISYPPLPEQKAIASVLLSLDDKIDLLHRQNKTLEAMAETLFRQWFIEEAKEDWEDISLNDILTTVSGYVRKPTDKDGDDKLLSMGVVSQNFGINDSACKPIDAADIPQQHKVSLYDLIISTRDVTQDAIFLGAPAIIPSYRKSENLYIGANLFKLQLINKNFGKWNLYCLLRSSPFREYVKDVASGTSILMLKKSDFLQYTFKCPDPNVLTDINSKLAILFNKIDNNLTNLMTLKKLRDTLLPKLMSGEVRVQIKEESAA